VNGRCYRLEGGRGCLLGSCDRPAGLKWLLGHDIHDVACGLGLFVGGGERLVCWTY